VTFQTKNELTLAMVQAVVASQTLRCRWFLADEAFGRDTGLLDAIDGLGLWYMVEVPLETPLWLSEGASATTPKTLFRTLPGSAWTRQLVGDGAKGPRIAEAHVRRVQAGRDGQPGPAGWLILRLDPESGEQKAFLSNAAASLTAARLVTVTGQRWPVEQIFEVGKPQLGMGAYEVRSWPGGHHHMTLATLAHFFLVRLQHRLKKVPMLTLPQVCLLLSVLLPLPARTLEDVLEQIAYYHRRHTAAETSHRERTERWIVNMDEPIGPQTPLLAPPIKA
jgi:SRSO17 transposase